jgi:uroporphyrinogen decarboxylase
MIREPMTREEVIKVIERRGGSRIPLVLHKWWGNELVETLGPELEEMAKDYPEDIFCAWYQEPGYEVSSNSNKSYRLGYKDDYSCFEKHSIGGSVVLLPDWEELDQFIDNYPNPNEAGNFDEVEKQLASAGGRYKLGCFWRLYHERFWTIRGMENLMMDYYDNMEGLRTIGEKVLEFYKVIVDRYKALGFDGIFTSDDLGHQTGPMMSPKIFQELYHPLYKQFISYVHSKGMHVFLHSCGDNTKLMEYLIDAGLDVFHPVQKGCMDEKETAKRFGGRISFLAGVDVQHLLPEASVEEVRKGVRELIDNLQRPDGGLLLAMGNGIMPGTPLENIEAAFREMAMYINRK